MSETLLAVIVGGLLTGCAAVGASVLATHYQTKAAREAYREQERVRTRAERLEAHHNFLNRVHRLMHAGEAIAYPSRGADGEIARTNFREALALTVDAYNRIDLVSPSNELAAAVLTAANPERLLKPDDFEAVVRAIAEASRIYRDAARAELGAYGLPA
jgi:hypothetical protein